MSTIVSIILFVIIFLFFAIRKEYVEILITLIIVLIIDFTVVKIFLQYQF